MANLLGYREYAKHRGVSHAAVQRAIDAERISVIVLPDGTKKINPETADVEWVNNTDESQKPHTTHARSGAPEMYTYAEARAVRANYEAKLLKLKYEKETAKLVDSEEMKSKIFQAVRTTRDAIMNIPDRISGILAAEGDQYQIHNILARELRQALEELSRAGQF